MKDLWRRKKSGAHNAFSSLAILWALCFCGMLEPLGAHAFSLLGPYADWMSLTNGYRRPGDIGGPMNLNEEYRWNVPVLTYGFDQSFLEFFGSNGVAAVESSIGLLNSLPPASQIDPNTYPLEVARINASAESHGLIDLKSATLFLLLEHFGLAAPSRYSFALENYSTTNHTIVGTVIGRNFEPTSYQATSNVNGAILSYSFENYFIQPGQSSWDAVETLVDPLGSERPAVADGRLRPGIFFSGLTRDDVGGLRYLITTNNINFETLITGVRGAGTNAQSFVNGAWRPGIDKITLVPHAVDSIPGAFLTMTNQFIDTYVTNGNFVQQQLERVIEEPDVLFSANAFLSFPMPFRRSGTTNWINHAPLNGAPAGAGPGVVQPPATVAFDKLGPSWASSGPTSDEFVWDTTMRWGSFDGSTNPPIAYPVLGTGTNQTTILIKLIFNDVRNSIIHSFKWALAGPTGASFRLQTSTNLQDWTSLGIIANDGSVFSYDVLHPASVRRYYQIVPQ